MMMPTSTAYVTRNWPEFSLLRKALDDTGLALIVNDTSTHNGQTLFAPSNKAFEKLGKEVNSFLFGPWGRELLRALLEYHVIANETLFTNSHFKANGRGPGLINNDVAPRFEVRFLFFPLFYSVSCKWYLLLAVEYVNNDITSSIESKHPLRQRPQMWKNSG